MRTPISDRRALSTVAPEPSSPSPASRPPSARRTFAGIDGLRAVAAGSVLVYHSWRFSAPNGEEAPVGVLSAHVLPHLWHGVTLFFILSGFLLYRPFVAALADGRPLPDIRRYARNRALRILPAYWVILLLVAFVLQTAQIRDAQGQYTHGALALSDLPLHVLFLQNYREATLFTGIGPAWSLCVEMVFYLLVPVFGAMAFALGARHSWGVAALAPALLLVALGLAGKALALVAVAWDAGVTRNFPGLADLFGYGMTVAVLSVAIERRAVRLPVFWRAAAIGALVVCVVGAVAFGIPNITPGGFRNAVYNVAFGVACALLLALVVLPADEGRGRTPWLTGVLGHRTLATVGLASYSLFLWHEPIIVWLREHGLTLSGAGGFAVNVLVAAVVSGLFAAVTYRCVERPAMRRRGKPAPSQEHAAP